MKLTLLYRGELSSCNYACSYCPFAKRRDSRQQLQRDRTELARFVTWLNEQRQIQWHVMFTPWGEALVRPWYRRAISELSQPPHLETVTVQTNLSAPLNWLADCQTSKLHFWATFHPTVTTIAQFLKRVSIVQRAGAHICVGMVAVAEQLPLIHEFRRQLPAEIYLWLNPQQPRPRPYTTDELEQLEQIDPYYQLTAQRMLTHGQACPTGETSFTVSGSGAMRRCHFIDQVIGNIYDKDWFTALQSRTCTRKTCDCYLGKSQFAAQKLQPIFGEFTFARTPLHSFATPGSSISMKQSQLPSASHD